MVVSRFILYTTSNVYEDNSAMLEDPGGHFLMKKCKSLSQHWFFILGQSWNGGGIKNVWISGAG